MSDVDIEDYVQGIEYRQVGVGVVDPEDSDWVVFHCCYGDTYQAFWEADAWWVVIVPGDPSDGPFESIDDVVDFLNNDE
jgi:hypothetical protein